MSSRIPALFVGERSAFRCGGCSGKRVNRARWLLRKCGRSAGGRPFDAGRFLVRQVSLGEFILGRIPTQGIIANTEPPKKSGAPAWDRGAPEGASQMPVSFSHRHVGSSILASLSEAGGNDSPKQQVSPFPLTCHNVRLVSETRPPVPPLHEIRQASSPSAFS
jgi:hypothetical protein